MGCFSSKPVEKESESDGSKQVRVEEQKKLREVQQDIERRENTKAIVNELYQSWNVGLLSGVMCCTTICLDEISVQRYMMKVNIHVFLQRRKTGEYPPYYDFPEHSTYELLYTMNKVSEDTISNPLLK
jgi:hypothetical protein